MLFLVELLLQLAVLQAGVLISLPFWPHPTHPCQSHPRRDMTAICSFGRRPRVFGPNEHSYFVLHDFALMLFRVELWLRLPLWFHAVVVISKPCLQMKIGS